MPSLSLQSSQNIAVVVDVMNAQALRKSNIVELGRKVLPQPSKINKQNWPGTRVRGWYSDHL
jgi:hypothetical protein